MSSTLYTHGAPLEPITARCCRSQCYLLALAPVGGRTIHTTANHPWLTTDWGWVPAGDLHSGEPIVREGGAWQAGINRSASVS